MFEKIKDFLNKMKQFNKHVDEELVVSEPVLSFVECVKNDPKRFRGGTLMYSYYGENGLSDYEKPWWISDLKLNKTYGYQSSKKWICVYNWSWTDSSVNDWITEDEIKYIVRELLPIKEKFEERAEKLKKLKVIRDNKKTRKELHDIYKELK